MTFAHRMITAETADSILLFHDGRLAEHGPHAELVAAGGRSAQLYDAWTRTRDGAR